MWVIVINIFGAAICAMWFFDSVKNESGFSALAASLLMMLNSGLLAYNINKMRTPDKAKIIVVETKKRPAIDTLILHGEIPDTTYVITAINGKIR